MNKPKCKACKKNFKVLTKEGLCDACFKKEFKFWSHDFSDKSKEKGGGR